ncbi:MAG: hypothetical protein L0J63_05445 [Tetragenococcus koreensis]|nr:hypothetical protein [Tetragenococcus koreensis]
MKTYNWIVLGALLLLSNSFVVKAQDVNIMIPVQNIFNHAEFTSVQTVMNTQGSSHWRAGAINPTIRSTSGNNFIHTSSPGFSLPTSVLLWRLASIGGQLPRYHWGDKWPGYKWLTTSNQTWYHPTIYSTYTPGNIDFSFKIPSNAFTNHAYHAGDYSIQITHNYGVNGFYTIEFSPDSFYAILSIPKAISWLTGNNTAYTEISSLNTYRTAPSEVLWDIGTFDLGNTVDFNLFAKTASSNIQFTSNNGVQETRNISLLKLGGNHPKISTLPLSSVDKNFISGNSFTVENGNRNGFQLNLSLSKADFKNYFFQAGTYKFQVNLNAKSTDNSVAAHHNVNYTLKVLPLSEITIPNLGNEVNFEFNTAAQYQNGLTKIIPNQLKLSNNEAYELYVKSDVPFFKRTGIQSTVPASILQVGVDGGSQQVALSTTPQKILSNGAPVLDKDLNMKYTIPSNAAQTLVAKEKITYSINVIYSFTAL